MAKKKSRRPADPAQIALAEEQIVEYSRTVKFTVTEYSFEFMVQKLKDDRYYVPEYQREHVWKPKQQSLFIESVLMGLPIPFVFFWQDHDGRMEIVDGSQRIRTIRNFMDDGFALTGLDLLPAANGLRFSDFSKSRQYKFSDRSLRVIILDNSTDAVTRTEMFTRINTTGTIANDAEVRRGSLPGRFMDMIIRLAESDAFVELTPISDALIKKREREELVTRFFAYTQSFDANLISKDGGIGDVPNYKEEPRLFYMAFVKDMSATVEAEIKEHNESQSLASMEDEFRRTLEFVGLISDNGFTKSVTGNQVPRVRFESIAVGSALALRERPELLQLAPNLNTLLNSPEYIEAIRSDAANVKSKLLRRIRLVREWLLDQ